MNMRGVFAIFLAGLLALPIRAELPPLLDAAVKKISDDFDHWAYTQTYVEKNEKGKIVRESVVRFDPSKPYAEQYQPLTINGLPPTEAQLKKYRRQGERRARQIEAAENEGTTPTRKTLGELMSLDHARLAADDAEAATFEVPLKKEGNTRLPPEKFRVTARVNKSLGAFERIDVELRSPMRAELVVKIKSGAGALEFASVNPRYSPTLTAITGGRAGSILFVPVGRIYNVKRDEFQRVKPFGDRFQVKMGPLKTIDF